MRSSRLPSRRSSQVKPVTIAKRPDSMKNIIYVLALSVVLSIVAACSPTATQTGTESDLAGTSWEATGFDDGSQAITNVLAGTTLTANFGEDGNLTGNSGCNEYNGPYKITGNQIGIGPLSS